MKKLQLKFFQRDTIEVARDLLGYVLVRKIGNQILKGRIVETEAYLGLEDASCHSYGGKITKRTQTMYLPGGHVYVYFTYGMHFCFNIITEDRLKPEACLIRALEPLEGLEIMQKNRNHAELTNGPAKLCKALKIDKELNGKPLNQDSFYIEDQKEKASFQIEESPRIGLNKNSDAYFCPLRFFISQNKHVSS